jgi:ketosteroid isomerase-like protein
VRFGPVREPRGSGHSPHLAPQPCPVDLRCQGSRREFTPLDPMNRPIHVRGFVASIRSVNTTIARYFDAMDRHDWATLRDCLSDQFSRVGPYEVHEWSDPDSYVVFLRELLPTIKGQHVEITEAIEEGPSVQVNATETIEVDGASHSVRVAATFHMEPDTRIGQIEVFVRQLATNERAAQP